MESFYDFEAVSLDGEKVSMQKYRGKVVLVVNTASKCGFTKQYEGLQKLHEQYADKGLAILGFPCNQFGHQEPGSSDDIRQFCKLNYGVSFDMFEKIKVNGRDTHPLFKYLKDKLPAKPTKAIKWNFTKFLLGRDAVPVKRFAPAATPEDIEPPIKKLL
jgi:glutathione peroxidase